MHILFSDTYCPLIAVQKMFYIFVVLPAVMRPWLLSHTLTATTHFPTFPWLTDDAKNLETVCILYWINLWAQIQRPLGIRRVK